MCAAVGGSGPARTVRHEGTSERARSVTSESIRFFSVELFSFL